MGRSEDWIARMKERKTRRTERIPAQTFLGALAPMPSPVTTAPPAMVEEKVLACGEPVLLEGGGERWVQGRGEGRGGVDSSFIYAENVRHRRQRESTRTHPIQPRQHDFPSSPESRFGSTNSIRSVSISVPFPRSVSPANKSQFLCASASC